MDNNNNNSYNNYNSINPIPNRRSMLIRWIILVAVILLICLVTLVGFTAAHNAEFRFKNISPSLSDIGADSAFMDINFSQPLTTSNLSVSASSTIINSVVVSGDTLKVNFKDLRAGYVYVIKIHTISDTKGAKLTNLSYTFTAKNIPVEQLPSSQQQALVNAQDKYPSSLKDPILSHLPHSTLDYILSDTFVGTKLILQAQILLAPGVSGTQATQDTTQDEQEVQQYIKSLNLNPANYTIQYQIVNESISGVTGSATE